MSFKPKYFPQTPDGALIAELMIDDGSALEILTAVFDSKINGVGLWERTIEEGFKKIELIELATSSTWEASA